MSPSALRRQVGRLLIAGFNGSTIPVELKALAREFGLGGTILLGKNGNIVDPEQVADLSYDLARLDAQIPAWVSVDQEGGRVARLKSPFTKWPPMATLGRSGDVKLAERFARALAAELKAVGITLDYAPVLDVHTNPTNPIIGDRALSERAAEVGRLGSAIIRELQAGGVAACGKHFPGHGDTSTDSHLELPLIEHPPERIREVELLPFREAVKAEVATIMTAHILVPSLDDKVPATLSRRIVTGMLRDELGYQGVILSDDLEMKAIADQYTVPQAAVAAVKAGCDGILVCQSGDHALQAQAMEAIVYAIEQNQLSMVEVDNALQRQQRAKERFLTAAVGSRPPDARALRQQLGRDEHQAIAHEMSRFV